MEPNILLYFVKYPTLGEVKTRLVPPLTPESAADLYRCLLLDKLLQIGQLHEVDRYVAYTPAEARHSVVAGWKLSAGQAALVPVQSSATSHTPAEARQVMEVTLAADLSAERNEPVKLPLL